MTMRALCTVYFLDFLESENEFKKTRSQHIILQGACFLPTITPGPHRFDDISDSYRRPAKCSFLICGIYIRDFLVLKMRGVRSHAK